MYNKIIHLPVSTPIFRQVKAVFYLSSVEYINIVGVWMNGSCEGESIRHIEVGESFPDMAGKFGLCTWVFVSAGPLQVLKND